MSAIAQNFKLQINKRAQILITPPAIIVMVFIISVIIVLAIQRTGVSVDAPEYIAGARNNMGMVWSLPGFLVYFGVQSLATTFPFALALGTTRKSFVLGTFLSHLMISAYVAAIMLFLLFLELATDHWFLNMYVLDIYAFGTGNYVTLGLVAFLGTLASLSLGGMFAAVWVRFGAKGPTILGLVLGLALATLVLMLVPYAAEIFMNFQVWWLAVLAGVIIAASMLGAYLSLRRASVR